MPSDAGPRMLEGLAKCGDKQSLVALLASASVEIEKAKEEQAQKTWAWSSRAPGEVCCDLGCIEAFRTAGFQRSSQRPRAWVRLAGWQVALRVCGRLRNALTEPYEGGGLENQGLAWVWLRGRGPGSTVVFVGFVSLEARQLSHLSGADRVSPPRLT